MTPTEARRLLTTEFPGHSNAVQISLWHHHAEYGLPDRDAMEFSVSLHGVKEAAHNCEQASGPNLEDCVRRLMANPLVVPYRKTAPIPDCAPADIDADVMSLGALIPATAPF